MYTIGRATLYDEGLHNYSVSFKKRGAHRGYSGGSVWADAYKAWAYLKANSPRLNAYSVYELQGSYVKDSIPDPVYPFNRLQKDRRIIRKIEEGK